MAMRLGARPASAWPVAIGRPNLLSSVPVVVLRVRVRVDARREAQDDGLLAHARGAGDAGRAARISWKLSMTTRPMPASSASRSSSSRLVVAVEVEALRREVDGQRDRQLAAGDDVEVRCPPRATMRGQRAAEVGLRGVGDGGLGVARAERVEELAALAAQRRPRRRRRGACRTRGRARRRRSRRA